MEPLPILILKKHLWVNIKTGVKNENVKIYKTWRCWCWISKMLVAFLSFNMTDISPKPLLLCHDTNTKGHFVHKKGASNKTELNYTRGRDLIIFLVCWVQLSLFVNHCLFHRQVFWYFPFEFAGLFKICSSLLMLSHLGPYVVQQA